MSRRPWIVLFYLLSGTVMVWAQAVQSPRQAFVEMLSGDQHSLEKHLLNETRAKLDQLPPQARQKLFLPLLLISAGAATSTARMLWMETGPLLLTVDDPKSGGHVEITVEKEELRGEEDEMEFSFRAFRQGEEQKMGFFPRILVRMRSEDNVWKLSDIGFTARVKLDAALVDTLAREMQRSEAASAADTKAAPSAAADAKPTSPAAKHVYTNDEIPSVSPTSSSSDADMDRPGFTDVLQPLGPLAQPDVCQKLCDQLSTCVAWVFHRASSGNQCELKKAVTRAVHKAGYTSGVKAGARVPPPRPNP